MKQRGPEGPEVAIEMERVSASRYRTVVEDMVSSMLERRPELQRMLEFYDGRSPALLTPRRLFAEVCWIGYASGFRYTIVERYWPRISKALYGFDVYRVASLEGSTGEGARRICRLSGFGNLSKASWCIENAKRISSLEQRWADTGGIRGFFESISQQPIESVVTEAPQIVRMLGLKGIGETTVFHLMKNVGIDIFKPDIHVRRLLANMGLTSSEWASASEVSEAMVCLAAISGYKVSQLDTFLFAYGMMVGDKLPYR